MPPPGRVNETVPHVGSVPLQSVDALAAVHIAEQRSTPPPIGRHTPVAQSPGAVHAAPNPSEPVGVGPQLKSTRFAPELLFAWQTSPAVVQSALCAHAFAQ